MQTLLSILLMFSLCIGIASGLIVIFLCLAGSRAFNREKKKLIITTIVCSIAFFQLLLLYNFVY